MTSQLRLYNRALSHMSTVRLANLTEDRSERHELDAVYTEVLQEVMEEGLWKFALRSSLLTASTVLEPEFGLPYAYEIPDDFVRLANIASDDRFGVELSGYREENGIWYTDVAEMYVRYVSNGASYGLNLGAWPENVAHFCGLRLAVRATLPITRDKVTRNDVMALEQQALAKARRLDAVDEPVQEKPAGRLVNSRFGNSRLGFRNGKMTFN